LNKTILTFLGLISFSSISHAENGFNWILSAGLTGGGETLAETTDDAKLKSGGLMLLQGGGVYSFETSGIQIQSTLGYHFDSVTTSEETADFDRYTFEILPFYNVNEKFRVGIGYLNILSANYSGPFADIDFKNANGTIFEVDYNLNNKAWIGIRYVQLEYIPEKVNGVNIGSLGEAVPLDGDYIGIIVGFKFL